MVIHNEELLITKSEFDMLRLYVWLWNRRPDQLLSGHRIENTEPECSSRRQDILGVLSDIHRFDGLFEIEDTDTGAIIGIVHAHRSII